MRIYRNTVTFDCGCKTDLEDVQTHYLPCDCGKTQYKRENDTLTTKVEKITNYKPGTFPDEPRKPV